MNAFIIYVYHRESQLRTQFSVYIGNVSITNLVSIFIQLPWYLSKEYHSGWSFDTTLCIVFLLADYTLMGCKIIGHLFPPIVALLGIFSPVWYRVHHTTHRALCVCATVWIFVILLVFLNLMPMTAKANFNCGSPCDIFRLITNSECLRWTFHYTPVAIGVFTAPLMWCVWKKLKIQRPSRHRPSVEAPKDSASSGQRKFSKRHSDQGWQTAVTVGLATLSIFFSWTPLAAIARFQVSSAVRQYVRLLFELQAVIDPVLSCVAQKTLRDSVLHRLNKHFRCK